MRKCKIYWSVLRTRLIAKDQCFCWFYQKSVFILIVILKKLHWKISCSFFSKIWPLCIHESSLNSTWTNGPKCASVLPIKTDKTNINGEREGNTQGNVCGKVGKNDSLTVDNLHEMESFFVSIWKGFVQSVGDSKCAPCKSAEKRE